MKRIACICAFLLAALLSWGVAGAPVASGKQELKNRCGKSTHSCAKGKHTAVKKKYPKKKTKPLARTKPSIAKNYKPSFFTLRQTERTIEAYKDCMYGAAANEDKIERALILNLSYRDEVNLRGSPDKLGREVCLADILGLKRYQTQRKIDRAKGATLFSVRSEFIEFPNDTGNRLPPERRFATRWVKEYIESLAQDLHVYLLDKQHEGEIIDVPLLRVNSLVRSLSAQGRQASIAACRNEICSTHLTGSTVDISNHPVHVSPLVRQWLRERLLADRREGKIIMIQEFFRPHFHIFVIPPQYLESVKTPEPPQPAHVAPALIAPSKPPEH